MKKNYKKIISFFVTAFMYLGGIYTIGCLTSCATMESLNCPYIINNLKTELGEKNEACKYAGTYFSFFNDSDKTVKKISVSFMLFENGENPFLGSNRINATTQITIPPKEAADISISLDKYLSVVPETPYEVDYFFVKEIFYEDNSKRDDPFGIYARGVNDDFQD